MAEAGQENMTKTAVVLHGLALNKWWTTGLAHSLEKDGYTVHNVSYPTRRKGFPLIVDEVIKPLIDGLPGGKVDFAVHSMGGLLLRIYAKKYGAGRIGRVVMLGTPNKGSEVADFLRDSGVFKWYFGDETGACLGTGCDDLPATLGPVPFECGVIAGDNAWFHFPMGALSNLAKPSDGVVSVESTKVEGMKDHVTLWLDHTLMVWSPKAWELTARFLRTGSFSGPSPDR
jgi:triacylglycerol lipase